MTRTWMERALADVCAERLRQDAKWGEQNHPSVDRVLMEREGGCDPHRMAEEYEIPTADRARFVCDTMAKRGDCTFAHIAVEELAEAVEAAVQYGQDSPELRNELVQCAAVFVAWIERVDRASSQSCMVKA